MGGVLNGKCIVKSLSLLSVLYLVYKFSTCDRLLFTCPDKKICTYISGSSGHSDLSVCTRGFLWGFALYLRLKAIYEATHEGTNYLV